MTPPFLIRLLPSARLTAPLLLVAVAALAGCATPSLPSPPIDRVISADPQRTESTNPIPILIPDPAASPPANRSATELTPITPGVIGSSQVTVTEPPKELWDRIRKGFAMPDLKNTLVTDSERWYSTRPDYIERMTTRSSKYLFHIVEELEMRKMPTELALLPFIESAFNPQAVSSAKAAGMWQFMPATGKYFELKQNVFRDDRRDVLASTRAALDYLQKLHGMFGDWHLALAAYNWGEGSVGRALAKNQRTGRGGAYTDLDMPAETRQYVPKLQAVKNIVANPQMYSTELPLIENHPYFQQVLITRDIDVELAARLADVKLEDFKALNPSAHRPVILAAGTPQILLPWDSATVFQRNFEAYTKGQYASWTAWTAPSTMNPAEAARRTGMSEADLRSVNNIPPRMLIKGGSTLLVPRAGTISKDVTVQVADNGHVALAPEAVSRRSTVKARKGDTVTSLAKRYSVSASSVAEWNDVTSTSLLKVGQQVVLFLPVKARTTPQSRSKSSAAHSKSAAATRSSGAAKIQKIRR